MHWVIQENLYNEEGFETLKRALEVAGLPYSTHKVVPFSHELIPDCSPEGKVIVMGAYTMIGIAKQRGWLPGAYSNDNFQWQTQWANWGDLMLNNTAWVGELRRVPPQESEFFIRPTDDSKHFAGTTMDWQEFSAWRDRILDLDWEGTISGDTPVIVTAKRTIYREYRTWVVGGKVVTASLYKEGSHVRYDSQVEPEIIEFANNCAAIWSPAPAYVLDVAVTPLGLKIVEINCINAAGFYKGDVFKLVQALEDLNE